MAKQKQLPEGTPMKGERWLTKDGRTVRVMADPVEGWIMYRFKGAYPNLLHANEWQKRFLQPNTQDTPKGRVTQTHNEAGK